MATASYQYGKPLMVKYTTAGSYLAGDVVVVGNTPLVAHEDNPQYTGGTLTDALSAGGGFYVMTISGTGVLGNFVYYDTVAKQVLHTPNATSVPFGVLVAGPSFDASGAAPTDQQQCLVLHSPGTASLLTYNPGAQGLANFRNFVDGGDMTINPAQRGTSQAADIANTLTYGPDRWAFKGGASSAINWSINADTSVATFSKSLKFQRKSANTDTAALNLCHVIETADSIRAQGQVVTFSFWAKKGANYSGGNLTVQVESGQGTDQSASNLLAGSWTSQAHVINTTQALTTTMTRYTFTALVPAATTQLGIILQWTPTGTAGADDSIVLNGLQLEIGASASVFEHRDIQVELEICQRYFWQINEPAAGVVVGMGSMQTTTTATIYMATPVQMRVAPTLTVTAGTFGVRPANAAISGTAAAGTTHTPNAISISITGATASTAGFATPLLGNGGAGIIAVSSDY